MGTKSKHTPPPWKFERMESAIEYATLTGKAFEDHDGYFRSNNGDWIVSRTDPDGELGGPICEVAFKGKAKRGEAYRAPDPEGQANARLIAAAPDLLEALEAITTPTGFANLEAGGFGTHALALAALAKARGQ